MGSQESNTTERLNPNGDGTGSGSLLAPDGSSPIVGSHVGGLLYQEAAEVCGSGNVIGNNPGAPCSQVTLAFFF